MLYLDCDEFEFESIWIKHDTYVWNIILDTNLHNLTAIPWMKKMGLPIASDCIIEGSKGQIKSECIYEIIGFPKYHPKFL